MFLDPDPHSQYGSGSSTTKWMRIRITLMRIRILLFTLLRIRILPSTLMWILILPFNLMRIRILPLAFPQILKIQCSKWPSKASAFSLWCGSGSSFSFWCGSGSSFQLQCGSGFATLPTTQTSRLENSYLETVPHLINPAWGSSRLAARGLTAEAEDGRGR